MCHPGTFEKFFRKKKKQKQKKKLANLPEGKGRDSKVEGKDHKTDTQ